MALVSCSPSFSRMCHKLCLSTGASLEGRQIPHRGAMAALGITRSALLVWMAFFIISIWKHSTAAGNCPWPFPTAHH